MKRLSHLSTLRIDPAQPLDITYGRKTMRGYIGDSIASVMYANGVRIFSRSLKYHRPRGLYSLEGECGNTLMEVDGLPNVHTEMTPASNGMVVRAQNVKGTPEYDLMGFMDKFSWAMPAGFFYSMFHRPAALWPFAAEKIRKAAGLGHLSPEFRLKGRYDEIFPTTDVCVIGGGPAGMRAALEAAGEGMRVILLERCPWLGGFFEYRSVRDDKGIPLHRRARQLEAQVDQAENIRVFKQTMVAGVYDDYRVTAVQQGGPQDAFTERYVEIHTRALVVATGCIERPLLFAHNERPGVMQISCAHRLARTWGILPGKRAVISTGHDLGLEAALDLHDLGMRIECLVDARCDGQDPELVKALGQRGITLRRNWVAGKALGRKAVRGVVVTNTAGTDQLKVACDTLITSAGLTPLSGVLSMVGAELKYDDHTGFFLPRALPAGVFTAGRMQGLHHHKTVEMSGVLAGLQAAVFCGAAPQDTISAAQARLAELPGPPQGHKLISAPVASEKVFLCFDEDATLKNVDQAMAKGFDVPELIKRFTAIGTGPGQGGISGHNLPLYVAGTHQSPLWEPGPTTIRSPLAPVLVGAVAGAAYEVGKRTPMVALSDAAHTRIDAQIRNIRTHVGMMDDSALGKFRIFGPDALNVLQRIYVSDMASISQGRAKYSAMCNEDGCVVDHGVVIKRAPNDYYFTTCAARAAKTEQWLRYHTRYDRWRYHIVDLTDAFGVMHLAGPNARQVLEKMTDADVSNDYFPQGACREFCIGDIAIRAMRLGFVGELSFELHVPASYMPALWTLIWKAGQPFGIGSFGLEALNRMRVEKGHIQIGSESEQRTTLHDLAMGYLWHRDKGEAHTVGAVALRQTEHQPGRLKLVGFQMEADGARPPREGAVIVDQKIRGYICTAFHSSAVNAAIGMALVEEELAAESSRLAIYEDGCQGALTYAKVVAMPFYDPEGHRMQMSEFVRENRD